MKATKWCINRRRLSPAQNEAVNAYFNKHTSGINFSGTTGVIHWPMALGKYYHDCIQPGYTSYSYADFRKYVQGEVDAQVAAIPLVVPEYVECIKGGESRLYTTGKIYKLVDGELFDNNGKNCGDKDRTTYPGFLGYLGTFGNEFKVSTKEAYDKQNPAFPEKWAIEVEANTVKAIGDYFNKNSDNRCYNFVEGFYHSHNYQNESIMKPGRLGASFHGTTRRKEYTLITFAQFEEHVLGKKPFVLPDKWVVQINSQNRSIVQEWYLALPIEEGACPSFSISAYYGLNQGVPQSWSVLPCDNTIITTEQFQQYVLNQSKTTNTMKAQSFQIEGSEELLEAIAKRLAQVGYNINPFSDTYTIIANNIAKSQIPDATKEIFRGLYNDCKGALGYTPDKSFTLPQDYNAAIEFAKAQLDDKLWVVEPKFKTGDWVIGWHASGHNMRKVAWKVARIRDTGDLVPEGYSDWCTGAEDVRLATPEEIAVAQTVSLPFGGLIFVVNKSAGTAKCSHGEITKDEIKAVIDWATAGPRLLTYRANIEGDEIIHFGCQSGTLAEAIAIYNAF